MTSVKLQPVGNSGQPFAGSDIIANVSVSERDPYEQLNDLMKVVEELCPIWPERETFRNDDNFLL